MHGRPDRGQVCALSHAVETASVRVTYDPALGEYAIAITPDRPWEPGPIFVIHFNGLDGIAFNDTAMALLGDRAVTVELDGTGPAVQALRDCADAVGI